MAIEPGIEIQITKTSTIKLDEDQAADLLRRAVNAPPEATVEFDCGYEVLREISIRWKEES